MLYQTTQEHEELRAKVREFAEAEIKPIAFMLDKNNQFPWACAPAGQWLRRTAVPPDTAPAEYAGRSPSLASSANCFPPVETVPFWYIITH